MSQSLYHGIVVSLSQRDKRVFERLHVIGKKKALLGAVTLYKVAVAESELENVIKMIQENMASKLLLRKQEFYAHFYRNDELIIVFRGKTFKATTDSATWKEAIAFGKSLGIAEKQLDFKPNRLEDETF